MELVKDIYFNTDKLIENTRVKVSYTGKFYQGNNEQVFIHYGYGKDWNNVNEVEMQKTDLGYQTELDLIGGDTLNFCFKNQNNEWDNNSGKNYIFNIEKTTVNKLGKTTIGVDAEGSIGSFFEKKFGGTSEKTTSSNIYEAITKTDIVSSSQNAEEGQNITISGVIEDNVIGTPNSIDTVFNANKSKTINNIETADSIGIRVSGNINQVQNDGLNIITPSLGNTIESINKPNINFGNASVGTDTTNLDNGITQKITYNLGVATPTVTTKWENTKVNIINPMAKAIKNTANQAVTITKNTVNKVTTATKNYINQNQGETQNALTVKPSGFNAWTQKVKATVSKFFAYVPKLISGNYKRNVSEDKK